MSYSLRMSSTRNEDLSSPFNSTPLPFLDLWVEMVIQGRRVISGVISNHPKHQDGMRILTSEIENYQTDAHGNRYANTKNTQYRLGERVQIRDKSYFFSASNSAKALDNIDKMTIC